MSRSNLQESWAITRKHLAAALEVLVVGDLVATVEEQAAIQQYEKFLDHNELELAMDELEAAVEVQSAPREFWRNLVCAARNMGLEQRADEIEKRMQ